MHGEWHRGWKFGGRLEQRLGRRKRMGSDGACHVLKDGKGWQRYMLDVFGY